MSGLSAVEWVSIVYGTAVILLTPLTYRTALKGHVSRRGAFWIGGLALCVAPATILAGSVLNGRFADDQSGAVGSFVSAFIIFAVLYVVNAKAEGLLRNEGGAGKAWDFTRMQAKSGSMLRRAPKPDWDAHTEAAFLHTPDHAVVPLKFAVPAYCIKTTGELAKLDEVVSRALNVERTESTLYAEFGSAADESVRLWAASERGELRVVISLAGVSYGYGAALDMVADSQAATELYREVARAVISTADGYSKALALADAEEVAKNALGLGVRPSRAKKVVLVMLGLVFVAILAFGERFIGLIDSWLIESWL